MPTPSEPPLEADLVDQLVDRLRRLEPKRRDPEEFHVERDQIATQLRDLATRLRGTPRATPAHLWINPNAPDHRRGTRQQVPDPADRRRRQVVRTAPFG